MKLGRINVLCDASMEPSKLFNPLPRVGITGRPINQIGKKKSILSHFPEALSHCLVKENSRWIQGKYRGRALFSWMKFDNLATVVLSFLFGN